MSYCVSVGDIDHKMRVFPEFPRDFFPQRAGAHERAVGFKHFPARYLVGRKQLLGAFIALFSAGEAVSMIFLRISLSAVIGDRIYYIVAVKIIRRHQFFYAVDGSVRRGGTTQEEYFAVGFFELAKRRIGSHGRFVERVRAGKIFRPAAQSAARMRGVHRTYNAGKTAEILGQEPYADRRFTHVENGVVFCHVRPRKRREYERAVFAERFGERFYNFTRVDVFAELAERGMDEQRIALAHAERTQIGYHSLFEHISSL